MPAQKDSQRKIQIKQIFILRPWREPDAEILFKWASDPDVGPRAGWSQQVADDEVAVIHWLVYEIVYEYRYADCLV